MTRRRWIADEFTITPASPKAWPAAHSGSSTPSNAKSALDREPGYDRAALTGAHAAHLARTLRARVGQEFEIVCGDQVRRGAIVSIADDRVEFALGELVPAKSVVPITLLLAIFKFDRMEWAIEKCTELNLTSLVPVVAHRTEKHLAAAAEKRVERWRRIAREASEQSRRVTPPEIHAPIKLKDALSARSSEASAATPLDACAPSPLRMRFDAPTSSTVIPAERLGPSGASSGSSESGLKIVLAETERTVMLADVLRVNESPRSLALAIGPEGGWTAEELRRFAGAHWLAASLGETILRAETAAVAAMAIAGAAISAEI